MKQAIKEITTSRGHTVRVLGISPLLMHEVFTANEMPDPPTYTVTTVTGDTEVHALDADVLDTDERKAQWEAYQAAQRRAGAARNGMLLDLFLAEGIEVETPDDEALAGWKKRMARYGVPVPDDPEDVRLAWIKREVIGSTDDLLAIQSAVMEKTGIGPNTMRRAEAMFRREMGRATAGDDGTEAGQMEHEPHGGGDDGGEGVGNHAA